MKLAYQITHLILCGACVFFASVFETIFGFFAKRVMKIMMLESKPMPQFSL